MAATARPSGIAGKHPGTCYLTWQTGTLRDPDITLPRNAPCGPLSAATLKPQPPATTGHCPNRAREPASPRLTGRSCWTTWHWNRTWSRRRHTHPVEATRARSDRAPEDQRVVITKDRDFRDSHLLTRSPRRLLVVAAGNITNAAPW